MQPITGFKGKRYYFEGIRVRELNFGAFKSGAAVTLPGIGIFTGPGGKKNTDLLKHEFGHILQRRRWGWWVFWFHIAPASLKMAAYKRKTEGFTCLDYMSNWTEWTANYLADQYFKGDFNRALYPVSPVSYHSHVKPLPSFALNRDDFIERFLVA